MTKRETIFCAVVLLVCFVIDRYQLFKPAVYPVKCYGAVGPSVLWDYSCFNTSSVVFIEWTYSDDLRPVATIRETTVEGYKPKENPFEPRW